jgi:hypothetical protein
LITFLGTLSHFEAMTLFAVIVSLTFAFLSKQTGVERAKYFALAFLAFMAVAVGIGWLMLPFSR